MAIVVDEYGGTAGPGHARGPDRGAGRRDRRRVRRRGAAGRAAARRRAAGQRRACRSTRSTSCSTPTCPRATGTRSAASVQPPRPRAGRGRDRSTSTASSCGPSKVQGRRISRVRITRLRDPDDGAGPPRRSRGAMKSGFVTLVGRPNVGQVDAAQPHPRHQGDDRLRQAADHPHAGARACSTGPTSQVVFVDTPGHPQAPHRCSASGSTTRPPTPSATSTWSASCSTPPRPIGRGDRFVAARVPERRHRRGQQDRRRLAGRGRSRQLDGRRRARPAASTSRCRPAPARASTRWSTRSSAGCPRARRTTPTTWSPTCPRRSGSPSWCASSCWPSLREELPHSIATRVTEWEWPRIRCEILVERDSQKGIVIGPRGAVLKEVGTAVREQLPEGAFLELFVKVDKDWQRRPDRFERLGY